MGMNQKVDEYFHQAKNWGEEMHELRRIILECGLQEEFKWGKPCYSFENKNLVIIQGFKKYLAILFLKGYLLKNNHNILVKTGENTVVGRQIRFNSISEILELEPLIKSHIFEAIEIEKSGLGDEQVEERKLVLVDELEKRLNLMPELKAAFEKLSPGRQKGYNMFISGSKQSKTRESRIEKCIPKILEGKGINEGN